MPSTFAAFARDHVEADVHRAVEVAVAPVAGERRVEHVAEPVQDHRLARPAPSTRRRRARSRRASARTRASARLAIRMMRPPRSSTAAHCSSYAAITSSTRARRVGGRVIGAGAATRSARRGCRAPRRRCARSARATSASRGPCRAARCPSLRRRRAPATTGGGGTRASRPSRARRRATGRCAASGSATTCAAANATRFEHCGRVAGAASTVHAVAQRVAARACRRRCGSCDGVGLHRGLTAVSGGTSTQRRSAQLFSPSSASCTPFAPSTRSQRNGVSVDDVAEEQLPLDLERVVVARVRRHLLPGVVEVDRLRDVGVPHRLRRGRARLDAAVGQPGDRGAVRAVDVERHEVVAAHARRTTSC